MILNRNLTLHCPPSTFHLTVWGFLVYGWAEAFLCATLLSAPDSTRRVGRGAAQHEGRKFFGKKNKQLTLKNCQTALPIMGFDLLSALDILSYTLWGLPSDPKELFLFNASTAGTQTHVYNVDVGLLSLLLELYMHYECFIRFRKSNQLVGWLKLHTGVPITKRCLPHWVMEMIAVAPCRALQYTVSPQILSECLNELQIMITQPAGVQIWADHPACTWKRGRKNRNILSIVRWWSLLFTSTRK